MLYLAEVKRQNRGFIGGFKTELKLLACQHNDQTWSAVPTEDIISWEDCQTQVGEGTLFLLELNNSRQIQGTPELAGDKLVRQLQKISRLMEKNKKEWEEIEQWKESLKIQAQELARRQIELENQQEQIEQMEQEFEYLERQRHEIEDAREKLKQEQENLEATKSQFGLPENLNPDQSSQIEALINRLASDPDSNNSPKDHINLALETVSQQQIELTNSWQQLEQKQASLEQRQQDLEQQRQNLERQQQELASFKAALEDAKIQLKIQETTLNNKQEILGQIHLNLETLEYLRNTLTRLAKGEEDISSENKVNIQDLENMPLGELEEIVNKLQAELDKIVRFVNDQEEELTLQCQTVNELKEKLKTSSEFERLSIEEELKDEQERKNMLDETLVGQRRTLWERQEILLQHLRVFRRRQGILEPEQQGNQINFTPLLNNLEDQRNHTLQERQKLETEIADIQTSIDQLKQIINEQLPQQENKEKELQHQQEIWQQAQLELSGLRSEIQLYESILNPLKNNLSNMSENLQQLMGWFSS
ncbi:conserved hypothetical protein [Gloeothece citriformis PCC 7424]|uniref:Uncharacterized protein n=1 Tax=Gloeothece citriformis (strain PCC 7424) TaxID=65393 RepID=B7KA44_GLOC7|nr:pilus motility taxis protein HmpF [Gloeothece citriformis]ACK71400.1 conserved hypothetical protein [Gloeothece citriformis PCC 7424]